MYFEHQDPRNRSITVVVLGVPNAGKSTLINKIIGVDLSIVSHLPQTTRNKILCITVLDKTEVIFVDTPGLHSSNREFNKRLNEQAREGIEGAEVALLMIDLTKEVMPQFLEIKKTLECNIGKVFVAFTKVDVIPNRDSLPLSEVIEAAKQVFPSIAKYFMTSSKEPDTIAALFKAICADAPNVPHHFPDGDISNKTERFFVTEYIREQACLLLKDELPHEVAVVIDEYRDFREGSKEFHDKLSSHISATILVNRPSQRAIVVGSQGRMIKEIGTRARKKIEAMVGGQVHLNLHVKVSPKWFNNNFVLEELGIPRAHDSRRVWRKK